jgi:transposase
LPDDPGVLKQLVIELTASLQKERADHAELRQNFDALLRRVWGPKSEKHDPKQPMLFDTAVDPEVAAALANSAPEANEAEDQAAVPRKKRKGAHGRRRVPESLERVVVEHDLTPAEKELLGGEENLQPLDDQVTFQYDWEPASLVIIEHHQKKYVRVEADAAEAPANPATATDSQNTVPARATTEESSVEPAEDVGSIHEPVVTEAPQAVMAAEEAAEGCQPDSTSAVAGSADGKTSRRLPTVAERVRARARLKFNDQVRAEVRLQCEAPIIVAPKPPQAIPGGSAAAGLLAQINISKYADHLPLHRLERIIARCGVHFARSTTCGWCAGSAKLLQPLAKLIQFEVLRSFVIHTDDTPVDVRNGRKQEKYKARFWTYWGDEEHPLVWFDFTRNRKREGPDRVLENYRGYLQADGYGGYDDYEGVELSESSPILKVACWAHARRKFFEAKSSEGTMAEVALAYIRQLYAIDKQIKKRMAEKYSDLSPENAARKIAEFRRAEARPVLDQFRTWVDKVNTDYRPLPKGKLAKALTYAINQWDALVRYLDDGRLDLDNNEAERALRGIAIGRRNWMFCGSENGGRTAATLFTIIASAIRNGLEPYQYLRLLLEHLPYLGENPTDEQLRPFMPNVWRPSQTATA